MKPPLCVRCEEEEAADNDIQYCVDCFDDASDALVKQEVVALEYAGIDLDEQE